jgi:hypothetical protein
MWIEVLAKFLSVMVACGHLPQARTECLSNGVTVTGKMKYCFKWTVCRLYVQVEFAGRNANAPHEENLRCTWQYVRRWKRWFLSGVTVSGAFKCPVRAAGLICFVSRLSAPWFPWCVVLAISARLRPEGRFGPSQCLDRFQVRRP